MIKTHRWILAASIFFCVGMYVGSILAIKNIQNQAVAEGAAEYITVSTDGHKDFRWIKPNCGPH